MLHITSTVNTASDIWYLLTYLSYFSFLTLQVTFQKRGASKFQHGMFQHFHCLVFNVTRVVWEFSVQHYHIRTISQPYTMDAMNVWFELNLSQFNKVIVDTRQCMHVLASLLSTNTCCLDVNMCSGLRK